MQKCDSHPPNLPSLHDHTKKDALKQILHQVSLSMTAHSAPSTLVRALASHPSFVFRMNVCLSEYSYINGNLFSNLRRKNYAGNGEIDHALLKRMTQVFCFGVKEVALSDASLIRWHPQGVSRLHLIQHPYVCLNQQLITCRYKGTSLVRKTVLMPSQVWIILPPPKGCHLRNRYDTLEDQ